MIAISWEGVMEAVLSTAKALEGRKVYGIPRGGTLVAALLSYHGCELVTTPPEDPCALQTTVIVDDIADTGGTLEEWKKRGFPTVALFIKNRCKPYPSFFFRAFTEKEYIKFPWESLASAEALEAQGTYKDHV